eukprot:TRINITY_DN25142_c2_g1_i1.p1 TRINITY_DN25142_c2_g1~~TRINITY_DN25142_c2_g1_i1.p1  ORF type:complete len:135 (-),score=31.36 TRINITY_DN25142_c2_g1_i1:161-565(-)
MASNSKPTSLPLLSLLLLVFYAISSSSAYQLGGGIGLARRVGGRVEIQDVESNKEIQALGRYSVQEYNKNHLTQLSFVHVIKAERQVVSGIKYYLKIHATDVAKKEFDAVVFVKPWKSSKQLLSFSPSFYSKRV